MFRNDSDLEAFERGMVDAHLPRIVPIESPESDATIRDLRQFHGGTGDLDKRLDRLAWGPCMWLTAAAWREDPSK
jgi:hypothetical protein